MSKLDVYDFDYTIYDGDSSVDYYIYNLKKNISLIRFLPIQIFAMVMYLFKIKDKEYFKSKYFSFVKGIKDIDNNVKEFWNLNEKNIKKELLLLATNDVLVISASPKFLLDEICKRNNIKYLIASNVDKTSGEFISKNCYGKEKVTMFNEKFKDFTIEKFYSDSKTDKYIASFAKESYMVNKAKVSKWLIE